MKTGKGNVTFKRPNKKSSTSDYTHNLISTYLPIYLYVNIYAHIFYVKIKFGDNPLFNCIDEIFFFHI